MDTRFVLQKDFSKSSDKNADLLTANFRKDVHRLTKATGMPWKEECTLGRLEEAGIARLSMMDIRSHLTSRVQKIAKGIICCPKSCR